MQVERWIFPGLDFGPSNETQQIRVKSTERASKGVDIVWTGKLKEGSEGMMGGDRQWRDRWILVPVGWPGRVLGK